MHQGVCGTGSRYAVRSALIPQSIGVSLRSILHSFTVHPQRRLTNVFGDRQRYDDAIGRIGSETRCTSCHPRGHTYICRWSIAVGVASMRPIKKQPTLQNDTNRFGRTVCPGRSRVHRTHSSSAIIPRDTDREILHSSRGESKRLCRLTAGRGVRCDEATPRGRCDGEGGDHDIFSRMNLESPHVDRCYCTPYSMSLVNP